MTVPGIEQREAWKRRCPVLERLDQTASGDVRRRGELACPREPHALNCGVEDEK